MAREREDYDDEEDDRPRRSRRDDDDYDDRPRRKPALTGMDGVFGNTNIVVLILFSCLCNGIALILGVIGLITCKDPTAKKNAMIVTIIGGIITALAVVANIMQAVNK